MDQISSQFRAWQALARGGIQKIGCTSSLSKDFFTETFDSLHANLRLLLACWHQMVGAAALLASLRAKSMTKYQVAQGVIRTPQMLGQMTLEMAEQNSEGRDMYWHVEDDVMNYRLLVDDGNDYGSQDFLEMDGSRKIDQKKLRFRFDYERLLPLGDIVPSSHLGVFFAKSEVFDLLSSVTFHCKHVLYNAKTDLYDLKIYVPMEEVLGFDFSKSSYEKFDDGGIYQINELKLVDGFSTDLDIFRLKDNFGTRFHIIVSDKFKYLYDKGGMTGLRFNEA